MKINPNKRFDYSPNQCLIFIKTFNSLHAVRPMNRAIHRKFKANIVSLINIFFDYYSQNQSIVIPQEIEKQLIEKYKISNLHLQSTIEQYLNTYGYSLD